MKCRLCGSGRCHSVLDLGEQALTGVFPKPGETVNVGRLELMWCEDCTLVQLADSYPAVEMYGANYGYRSGLNRSMVEHLERKVLALQARASLAPGETVLDIGSNDGTLLGCYTVNPRRIGIDPTSGKFAEHYQPGIERVADFFSAARFHEISERPAKIITSIAMLYDLENPVGFAKDVRDCLADDGLWHFEQSYLPAMLKATSYDMVCHEHVEYYSLATIKRILDEAALEIVDVQFNKVNGGSFAVTATHQGSPRTADRALVDWALDWEGHMRLDTRQPFDFFREHVHQHREDLRTLIRGLRDDGSTVGGYGASTKGNVLLQFCDLGPDDIEAIAEVNDDKFGRVTPGTHIPIISEAQMRERRPDYLMVLPWHFRDGIVKREREYLAAAGKLIFPLPEIEIVGA